MACPVLQGKGYTFTEMQQVTMNPGDTISSFVFTAEAQDGFILDADVFFVRSSSSFVDQVVFTQNGNDVDITVTLTDTEWPSSDRSISIDVEASNDPVAIDRTRIVTIYPIDDSYTYLLESGAEVPITALGYDFIRIGPCGEVFELPEIFVDINRAVDGSDLGTDNTIFEPQLPPIENGTLGLSPLGMGIFGFRVGLGVSETDDQSSDEDITNMDAINNGDNDAMSDGTAPSLGVSFLEAQAVLNTLFEPEDSSFEIDIDTTQIPEEGENRVLTITGNPQTTGVYSVTIDGVPLLSEARTTVDVDEDGCPVETTTTITYTNIAFTIGEDGTFAAEIAFPEIGSGVIGCSDIAVTASIDDPDSPGDTVTKTENILQCNNTNDVLVTAKITTTEDLDGNPSTVDSTVPVTISEVGPEERATEGTTTLTIQPSSGGTWIQLTNQPDNLIDCWSPNPLDIYECFKTTVSLVAADPVISPSGMALQVEFEYSDGVQPTQSVELCFNADCVAHDPPVAPGTSGAAQITVTVNESVDNVSVTPTSYVFDGEASGVISNIQVEGAVPSDGIFRFTETFTPGFEGSTGVLTNTNSDSRITITDLGFSIAGNYAATDETINLEYTNTTIIEIPQEINITVDFVIVAPDNLISIEEQRVTVSGFESDPFTISNSITEIGDVMSLSVTSDDPLTLTDDLTETSGTFPAAPATYTVFVTAVAVPEEPAEIPASEPVEDMVCISLINDIDVPDSIDITSDILVCYGDVLAGSQLPTVFNYLVSDGYQPLEQDQIITTVTKGDVVLTDTAISFNYDGGIPASEIPSTITITLTGTGPDLEETDDSPVISQAELSITVFNFVEGLRLTPPATRTTQVFANEEGEFVFPLTSEEGFIFNDLSNITQDPLDRGVIVRIDDDNAEYRVPYTGPSTLSSNTITESITLDGFVDMAHDLTGTVSFTINPVDSLSGASVVSDLSTQGYRVFAVSTYNPITWVEVSGQSDTTITVSDSVPNAANLNLPFNTSSGLLGGRYPHPMLIVGAPGSPALTSNAPITTTDAVVESISVGANSMVGATVATNAVSYLGDITDHPQFDGTVSNGTNVVSGTPGYVACWSSTDSTIFNNGDTWAADLRLPLNAALQTPIINSPPSKVTIDEGGTEIALSFANATSYTIRKISNTYDVRIAGGSEITTSNQTFTVPSSNTVTLVFSDDYDGSIDSTTLSDNLIITPVNSSMSGTQTLIDVCSSARDCFIEVPDDDLVFGSGSSAITVTVRHNTQISSVLLATGLRLSGMTVSDPSADNSGGAGDETFTITPPSSPFTGNGWVRFSAAGCATEQIDIQLITGTYIAPIADRVIFQVRADGAPDLAYGTISTVTQANNRRLVNVMNDRFLLIPTLPPTNIASLDWAFATPFSAVEGSTSELDNLNGFQGNPIERILNGIEAYTPRRTRYYDNAFGVTLPLGPTQVGDNVTMYVFRGSSATNFAPIPNTGFAPIVSDLLVLFGYFTDIGEPLVVSQRSRITQDGALPTLTVNVIDPDVTPNGIGETVRIKITSNWTWSISGSNSGAQWSYSATSGGEQEVETTTEITLTTTRQNTAFIGVDGSFNNDASNSWLGTSSSNVNGNEVFTVTMDPIPFEGVNPTTPRTFTLGQEPLEDSISIAPDQGIVPSQGGSLLFNVNVGDIDGFDIVSSDTSSWGNGEVVVVKTSNGFTVAVNSQRSTSDTDFDQVRSGSIVVRSGGEIAVNPLANSSSYTARETYNFTQALPVDEPSSGGAEIDFIGIEGLDALFSRRGNISVAVEHDSYVDGFRRLRVHFIEGDVSSPTFTESFIGESMRPGLAFGERTTAVSDDRQFRQNTTYTLMGDVLDEIGTVLFQTPLEVIEVGMNDGVIINR